MSDADRIRAYVMSKWRDGPHGLSECRYVAEFLLDATEDGVLFEVTTARPESVIDMLCDELINATKVIQRDVWQKFPLPS